MEIKSAEAFMIKTKKTFCLTETQIPAQTSHSGIFFRVLVGR